MFEMQYAQHEYLFLRLAQHLILVLNKFKQKLRVLSINLPTQNIDKYTVVT